MARLPPGVGAGLSVNVLVEGFPGAMAAIFSYDAPVLTAVLPSVAPTSGGVLTVLGLNFGVSNLGNAQSLSTNGTILETTWTSDSTFTTRVLAGTGGRKSLTCNVSSQESTFPAMFS
jgi:hypothetical protein